MVLGCAGLLAAHPGVLVVTVAAGKPGPHTLTEWDRACGFAQGDDVVGARRREDSAALAILGARPVWLDFLDSQYAPSHHPSEVLAAIENEVQVLDVVASPLGLGHEDHLAIAAACLEIARRWPDKRWILYEDVIYRTTVGGTEEALAGIRQLGFDLAPEHFSVAVEAKRSAVDAYVSQVKGLGDLLRDADRPERYWSLTHR